MHTPKLFIAASAVAALALAGCSSGEAEAEEASQDGDVQSAGQNGEDAESVEPGTGEPLTILLTNDDGWDAPGITAAHEALTEAGHDVTIVAPADNQSGQGGAVVVSGTIEVTQPTDDETIYSVGGTPATSAAFGLQQVFDDDPDLVISGINEGANAGTDIRSSGTFGAASIASGAYHVPAIATSLDASTAEDQADYEHAADLIVDILDHGIDYLDPGYVLNMNYPDPGDDQSPAQDIVYAETSPSSGYQTSYEQGEGDTWEVSLGYADEVPDTGDLAELANGNATITLVTNHPSVPLEEAGAIGALVDSLNS